MNDTGLNIPETVATLQAQQQQLVSGRRLAQMFPLKTKELELPARFERLVTKRGVFHFNPEKITEKEVHQLSEAKRENVLLGLGPYNKRDVMGRHLNGEPLLAVTERTPDGIEVKSAVGTHSTVAEQVDELEQSKTPGNQIAIEDVKSVLLGRLKELNNVSL